MVTLELDAYEKLRISKRESESFSDMVRRTFPLAVAPTGAELRRYYAEGGSGLSDEYLDAVEAAAAHDPIPEEP